MTSFDDLTLQFSRALLQDEPGRALACLQCMRHLARAAAPADIADLAAVDYAVWLVRAQRLHAWAVRLQRVAGVSCGTRNALSYVELPTTFGAELF